MDAKAREIDKIIRKLGMETRNTSDLHAWLVYDGVPVIKTRRSFGNSKYVPADKIRCQLKVNEQQFAGLISCDVTKEDYIKILIAKRVIIPKQEQPPADQTPKAPC
ncbi:MAG TPA: hypothetical protein VN776_14290 [Terracidiphilus sp.]|nr:hypothetical protein [Terracidiphilus sp.]